MSERGSFVTEYVSCIQCFEACKRVLLAKGKFLCSQVLTYTDGSELPIIAGKIGGAAVGDELLTFEHEIARELEPLLCHPLDIAVLSEAYDAREIVHYVPREQQ